MEKDSITAATGGECCVECMAYLSNPQEGKCDRCMWHGKELRNPQETTCRRFIKKFEPRF